jgi:hypothetical protein
MVKLSSHGMKSCIAASMVTTSTKARHDFRRSVDRHQPTSSTVSHDYQQAGNLCRDVTRTDRPAIGRQRPTGHNLIDQLQVTDSTREDSVNDISAHDVVISNSMLAGQPLASWRASWWSTAYSRLHQSDCLASFCIPISSSSASFESLIVQHIRQLKTLSRQLSGATQAYSDDAKIII